VVVGIEDVGDLRFRVEALKVRHQLVSSFGGSAVDEDDSVRAREGDDVGSSGIENGDFIGEAAHRLLSAQ
jgi:hypothetical protein